MKAPVEMLSAPFLWFDCKSALIKDGTSGSLAKNARW